MNINDLYMNALLAQATYANKLTDGMEGEDLARKLFEQLKKNGMTQAQAEYFSSKYEVVTQQSTTDSGFSATVFKRITDSSYHFAMRGTDFDGADIANNVQNFNYGMSYDQVADLLNFYLKLTHTGSVQKFAH